MGLTQAHPFYLQEILLSLTEKKLALLSLPIGKTLLSRQSKKRTFNKLFVPKHETESLLDDFIFELFYPDSSGSFLPHLHFKANKIPLLDRFKQIIDMYKNTFLSFGIFYKSIPF